MLFVILFHITITILILYYNHASSSVWLYLDTELNANMLTMIMLAGLMFTMFIITFT